MSGTEWLVVLAGVSAIGWVNWYFFVGGRPATTIGRPQDQEKEER